VAATPQAPIDRMRAAVITRHGGPEVLEVATAPRPRPGPGAIRVRVDFCALNALDIFVRRGTPGIHVQLPHISGGDVVGHVDQVGEGADRSLLGAQILVDPLVEGGALGESAAGGLAEHVVVPAANAIRLPLGAPHPERFAALPIAYGTARRMLFTRARLLRGETLVVLGAAGGVGVACVQLGHQAGARVIACSSSPGKLERLRRLGADELVDTSVVNASHRVWELTGRSGADVVVDYLGRDTWAGSVRCTRRGGRLVTCGATTGFEATIDLRYLWTRELNILGSDGWAREDLEQLVALVADGRLEPVIHAVHELEDVAAAMAALEQRQAFGKVVVHVG